jgi:hypothetical protein
LHIAAAIRNHVNDNFLVEHTINDSIGLEEHLTVLLDSERAEFLRLGASFGRNRQTLGYFKQPLENVICARRRIELRDVRYKFSRSRSASSVGEHFIAH